MVKNKQHFWYMAHQVFFLFFLKILCGSPIVKEIKITNRTKSLKMISFFLQKFEHGLPYTELSRNVLR